VVKPWFADHGVSGRAVLPAVEALLFLAARSHEACPAVDITSMREVRLTKFLDITNRHGELEVLVEMEDEDGWLSAALCSETPLKGMTRVKEHCRVLFRLGPDREPEEEACDITLPRQAALTFSATDIYRRMVPFGPTYHSLQGTLCIDGNHALGTVRAPLIACGEAAVALLGSPFPCDGAMHAACVLGQQRASFIPFPVGMATRQVLRPTQPGQEYLVCATLTAESPAELTFALRIADTSGRLCEKIDGLRMRDAGLFQRASASPAAALPPATPKDQATP
jgi:hypothetical protein